MRKLIVLTTMGFISCLAVTPIRGAAVMKGSASRMAAFAYKTAPLLSTNPQLASSKSKLCVGNSFGTVSTAASIPSFMNVPMITRREGRVECRSASTSATEEGTDTDNATGGEEKPGVKRRVVSGVQVDGTHPPKSDSCKSDSWYHHHINNTTTRRVTKSVMK